MESRCPLSKTAVEVCDANTFSVEKDCFKGEEERVSEIVNSDYDEIKKKEGRDSKPSHANACPCDTTSLKDRVPSDEFKVSTSRCEGGMSWADVLDEEGDEFLAPIVPDSRLPDSMTQDSENRRGKEMNYRYENNQIKNGNGSHFKNSSLRDNSGRQLSGRPSATSFRDVGDRRDARGRGGLQGLSNRDDDNNRHGTTRTGHIRGNKDSLDVRRNCTATSSQTSGKARPGSRTREKRSQIVASGDGEEWMEVIGGARRTHIESKLTTDQASSTQNQDMWGSDNGSHDRTSDEKSNEDQMEESSQEEEEEEEEEETNLPEPEVVAETEVDLPKKVAAPMTKKDRMEAKQRELDALTAVLSEFTVSESPASDSTSASTANPSLQSSVTPGISDSAVQLLGKNKKKQKSKQPSEKNEVPESNDYSSKTEVNVEALILTGEEALAKAKQRVKSKKAPQPQSGANESILAAVASEAKKKKSAAAEAVKKKQKKNFQFPKQR